MHDQWLNSLSALTTLTWANDLKLRNILHLNFSRIEPQRTISETC